MKHPRTLLHRLTECYMSELEEAYVVEKDLMDDLVALYHIGSFEKDNHGQIIFYTGLVEDGEEVRELEDKDLEN